MTAPYLHPRALDDDTLRGIIDRSQVIVRQSPKSDEVLKASNLLETYRAELRRRSRLKRCA